MEATVTGREQAPRNRACAKAGSAHGPACMHGPARPAHPARPQRITPDQEYKPHSSASKSVLQQMPRMLEISTHPHQLRLRRERPSECRALAHSQAGGPTSQQRHPASGRAPPALPGTYRAACSTSTGLSRLVTGPLRAQCCIMRRWCPECNARLQQQAGAHGTCSLVACSRASGMRHSEALEAAWLVGPEGAATPRPLHPGRRRTL